MKRFLTYISFFFATIGFAQNSIPLPIENNPLPTDTLRVLMIGNSFTDDATEYIRWIVKNSGIDENTCCVYSVMQGYSSVETWKIKYDRRDTVSIQRKAGNIIMPVVEGNLQEILHQNWDVISLQQLSNHSHDISTFSPYLDDLLSYVKKDCVNKDVAVCWHLTWSYSSDCEMKGPKGYAGWASIVSTVEQMIQKYGVDIIVPSGTAIQNARATSLNTDLALTRDGYHLDYDNGRYIAACTLFESLFEPVYGVSVANVSWHPKNVIDSMSVVARECAIHAVENWHEAPHKIANIQKNDFVIFPNPTTDDIFICKDSVENPVICIIYDSLGNRVYKEKIIIKDVFRVDASQFKRGTYTIQLKCGKIEKIQRIEKL